MQKMATQLSLHDRAVQDIAAVRFDFSAKHPTWTTYTNHPRKQEPIVLDQEKCWPDIVVRDGQRKLKMIAEVEVADTVTDDEAEQWSIFSSAAGRFYLYVPKGYGTTAQAIARRRGISIDGFREWWYERGRLNVREL